MADSKSSEAERVPVPFAHLALLTVAVLPLFYVIDPGLNVVLLACLCVYVGCWRSVKPLPPVDAMTRKVSTSWCERGMLGVLATN